MRILSRYLLREMAPVFFLSLAVFLFVLFANRMLAILQFVLAKGATLKYAGSLLLSLMPSFLVYAIPMAFILSLLLAYGRLSADSEIVAMRASGLGLWQITRPAIEVGLVLAIITTMIAVWAAPWGRHRFGVELYKLASNQISVGIQERIFNQLGPGVVIYADRVESGKLTSVLLSDTREKQPVQIFAQSGHLRTREGVPVLDLDLFNGRVLAGSPVSDTVRYIDFDRLTVHLDLRVSENSRTYYQMNEMNIYQLRDELRLRKKTQGRLTPVWLEIHRKFTIPMGCILIPFLAIPLAMTNRRAGRTQGFVTALVIITGYYLLLTLGQNAVKQGKLPVTLGMWLANIVLACLGSWLFWRASAGRPLLPTVRR